MLFLALLFLKTNRVFREMLQNIYQLEVKT